MLWKCKKWVNYKIDTCVKFCTSLLKVMYACCMSHVTKKFLFRSNNEKT